MQSQIDFEPIDHRVHSLFPNTDALNHEKNQIFSHAIKLACKLFVVYNKDHIILGFKESNGHKSVVHYVNGIASCSCKEYISHEASFCKHIAILEYYLKYYFNYQDLDSNEFQRTLKSNVRKLICPKDKKFVWYDSYKREVCSVGEGEDVVYTPSYKRFVQTNRGKVEAEKESANLPDSYNLLDDITLKESQVEAMQLMIKAKRAICGMPMGAGKTITSIAVMDYLKINDALIICPKSIAIQWKEEIKRCIDKDSMIINKGKIGEYLKRECIGICTYQTFARNIEQFKTRKYNFVILDEIQFIRNDESKTWGAINKIESEYFYGLSGTVIENSIDDLYNIMHVVDPNMFGPKWKFNDTYRYAKSYHKKKIMYIPGKVKNLSHLKDNLKDCVYSHNSIKYTKITHNKNYVALGEKAKKIHDDNIEMANKLIKKSLDYPLTYGERIMIQSYLLKARQCCNSIKLVDPNIDEKSDKFSKIVKVINGICENEKVVVFSEWTTVLKIIQSMTKDIGFTKLTGAMSQIARRKSINEFKSNKDCKIFFSSDAGGLGVDGLQFVCNNIIHTELPWNPARIDQRNGRLHRMMQEKDVNVHYFITKDSIENKMETTLEDKRKIRVEALF
jgi:SNF2 family DNA or RNA helicase